MITPTVGHSSSQWVPEEEPPNWYEVRQELMSTNRFTDSAWIYVESLQSEKVLAAEYLADVNRISDTVNFNGALIMRRLPSPEWVVRIFPMRALCGKGLLQRQDPRGVWKDYPGRTDTFKKVNWICSLAPFES
ncbi:hypothetical protein [Synechococcus sp. MIT S1220]|uniref:hypothetical protein n=1 Tax=Synechococcus sp. MIT S1220 TaxID=3082549 RepID=UPI0039AF94F6